MSSICQRLRRSFSWQIFNFFFPLQPSLSHWQCPTLAHSRGNNCERVFYLCVFYRKCSSVSICSEIRHSIKFHSKNHLISLFLRECSWEKHALIHSVDERVHFTFSTNTRCAAPHIHFLTHSPQCHFICSIQHLIAKFIKSCFMENLMRLFTELNCDAHFVTITYSYLYIFAVKGIHHRHATCERCNRTHWRRSGNLY